MPRHSPYALILLFLSLHRCLVFNFQYAQGNYFQMRYKYFYDAMPKLKIKLKTKLHRKEVIQPHVPVRLPCYDFTPLIRHTFDGSVLAVQPPASGTPNSGGVTGGVYKARERIHRSLADLRLLAIPAS